MSMVEFSEDQRIVHGEYPFDLGIWKTEIEVPEVAAHGWCNKLCNKQYSVYGFDADKFRIYAFYRHDFQWFVISVDCDAFVSYAHDSVRPKLRGLLDELDAF